MKTIAILSCFLTVCSIASLQTPIATETLKLTASNSQLGDIFGSNIAVSEDGTMLLIAALKANDQKG